MALMVEGKAACDGVHGGPGTAQHHTHHHPQRDEQLYRIE